MLMYLLQGKQYTCDGRIEGGRQSGAGSAGNEKLFLCFYPFGGPGEPLCRHGSQLNAGAFASQGQSASQGYNAASQLGKQHTPPLLINFPNDFPFNLGNAAA